MDCDFCNIHAHSEYSLLDGKAKIPEMVQKAKSLGQKSLGIMDHGNTYGHVEFYNECINNGINPVLGNEFYVVESLTDEEGKNVRSASHMSVVAINNDGLRNLNKLTTISNKQFHYKPKITPDQLIEHNEGLIIFSGCFASLISQYLLSNEDDKAIDYVKKYKEAFGDRFYLELQNSGIDGQDKVCEKKKRLSRKYGIKCIVTNDSHYVNKSDSYYHSVLLAINTNAKMSDAPIYEGGKRFAFSTDEYYMKSVNDFVKEGWDKRDLNNTIEIAEMSNVSFDTSIKIPKYPFVPNNGDSFEYLSFLCKKGWYKRGIHLTNDYRYQDRAKYELKQIKEFGLSDYFLIVSHYVNWAKDNNIGVGPGRGSAAGSLVSYLLGITNVDPIKYGLYWERFWNAGRSGVGMPDIDVDFSQDRRADVIEFIKDTFGRNKVLPVISFGKMMVKGVLKDVGRALGISHDKMNEITKAVPFKVDDLDDAIKQSPDLKKYSEKYKKLFTIAKSLQDTCRHTSVHPCAVVILTEDVNNGAIPLAWDTKSKQMITGYDMHALEKLGYMKMDILGLKNLDILSITQSLIGK